jgi:hypothetical protein
MSLICGPMYKYPTPLAVLRAITKILLSGWHSNSKVINMLIDNDCLIGRQDPTQAVFADILEQVCRTAYRGPTSSFATRSRVAKVNVGPGNPVSGPAYLRCHCSCTIRNADRGIRLRLSMCELSLTPGGNLSVFGLI